MRRVKEEAAKTRSVLLEAGLRVFAERGFTSATLAEISAAAGVTRGAAYHHFADKADLYRAAVAQRWTVVGAEVMENLLLPTPPRDRLRRFLLAFHTAVAEDDRFGQLLRVIGRNESIPDPTGGDLKRDAFARLAETLVKLFEEAGDRRELAEHVTPRSATSLVITHITGLVMLHSLALTQASPGDGGPDEPVETMLRGFFR